MRRSLPVRAAVLLLLGLPLVLVLAGAPLPAASGKRPEAAQDSKVREVWWRNTAVRILDLDGAWAPRAEQAVTFIEPEGPGCVLRLLRRSTGEVFEYSMRPEGQVALAFGWLFLSVERPLALAELLTSRAERPEGFQKPAQVEAVNVRELERIVFYGDAPLALRALDDPARGFRLWRRTGPSAPGSLEIQSVLGMTWRLPSSREETLTSLEVTSTPPVQERGWVEFHEVPPRR